MAILGLGTDIVEVARIKQVMDSSGHRFAKRLLSEAEYQHYLQHAQPVRYMAKRFAVKEAAAKALGTGFRNGLAFNQFEVYNDTLGKPCLRFYGQARSMIRLMGVRRVHVTLADERRYACATVILEGDGDTDSYAEIDDE